MHTHVGFAVGNKIRTSCMLSGIVTSSVHRQLKSYPLCLKNTIKREKEQINKKSFLSIDLVMHKNELIPVYIRS